MTKKSDVYSVVKTMLADRFGMQESYVKSDLAFSAFGADSLDVTELIMELEDIFSIQIEDEKISHLNTVGDMVSYIYEKTSEKVVK
ncbi:acyl carrier protein [Aerococcaceae bacterium DSM 111176]|nr:acyl carrier protein [Aerococcaceae bacterium DSM 111176]